MSSEWKGDNPFYLVIQREGGNAGIDLDEPGWAETYKDFFRDAGVWLLVHKATNAAVLTSVCHDGDQGYYTARHIGKAVGDMSREVVAFGIGKKKPDGQTTRLWFVEGTVCANEDVEEIAAQILESRGPIAG
jgi:hypothetical protein